VRQAKMPLPDRLHAYTLLLRLGAQNLFTPGFLGSVDVDQPLHLTRHVWNAAKAKNHVDRMLATDWKFTLADNDLPKVTRSCELAGVEVAYPFLSDELRDFAAHLPTPLKVRGSKLRWLFKHALRNYLPKKILRKKKHGFGLPFGVWLRTHRGLQQLVGDTLSELKGRGIVEPRFVDEIVRLHRTEHASYYGVMIWQLIMLEQWYRIHEDQPVHAS